MPESARKRLDSWKEIATYLDRDVTTVMRWEREKKLPVHRLPGGKRKAVFAYPDEIDAWYASADPKENGESSEGAEPREVPAEGRSLEPAIAPIIDTPNPPSKRWRRTALVLVPAVVILLGLGAMTAARLRPAPQLKVSSYLPLTRDGHDKGGPLFTDGARVYFLEQGPDGPELAAVAIAGSGTAIIPCGCLSVEDFSPLHSEVLASRPPSTQDGGELWVMPLLGGSPRRVGDIKASYATWSSDRRRIAFTRQDALYIANADGSEALRIANVTGQAAWPRWSPDGSTLRFTEDTYQHGRYGKHSGKSRRTVRISTGFWMAETVLSAPVAVCGHRTGNSSSFRRSKKGVLTYGHSRRVVDHSQADPRLFFFLQDSRAFPRQQ